MRKALLTVISFTLCLYITSCSQSSKPEKARTIETIATDAQQTLSFNHEPLSIDPIGIGDILSSVVRLILDLNKEENMLHVYNLPHLQFLGSFQKIGNGPDEVILPSAFTQWFNKDGQIQLVMRSYQKFTGLLNISKSLIENKAIYDNKYTYNAPKGKNSFQQSSVSYLLGDSIFLINRSIIMRPQDNQNDFFEVYDYKNDSILRSFYASNFPKELLEHHGRDQAFQKDIAISNDCKKMVIAYRFLNMISIVNIEKEEINNLFTDGNKLNWEQVIEGTPKPYYTKVHCNNAYIWAMAIEGEDPSTFRSRLDIFDWKGNYLCKAHLDKWVSSFSIDERNQTMYAVTADDMLVRYNIKELLDQLP